MGMRLNGNETYEHKKSTTATGLGHCPSCHCPCAQAAETHALGAASSTTVIPSRTLPHSSLCASSLKESCSVCLTVELRSCAWDMDVRWQILPATWV